LLAEAHDAFRPYDCRIAGMRWSPAAPKDATPVRLTAAELEFEGRAGEILRDSERFPTTANLHAAGVASLLLRRPADAVNPLVRAAQLSPGDARVSNDLATALCAAGIRDPSRLPGALAAVDRSLGELSASPEARFNRALVLMHLGLRNEALRAWRHTLEVERDPQWSAEAKRRLAELAVASAPSIATELRAVLPRANDGDVGPLANLVQRRVEEVRTNAESVLVTTWAEALTNGRAAEAKRMLSEMRALAAAIAATNGERLMADLVRQIDMAPSSLRMALARAYVAYRVARLHYRDQTEGSDVELRRVATRFEELDSPMQYVARYYAANAMFDRTHVDEAIATLEQVLRAIDPHRYPSLAAGVQKQLGLCYGFRGLWTTSLLHLDRAHRLFAATGEPVNTAFTEAILGEAYDRIGQFRQGWRHRIAALRVLSRSPPDDRSLSVIVGAAHAEMMRGDYDAALSLLAVAHEEAPSVADPIVRAEMLVREVRVLLTARNGAGSSSTLAATKQVAAEIRDSRARLRMESEIRIAEAELVRRSDPRRAIEILTPAIEFYESKGLGILLPPAYLQRGRAYKDAGSPALALRDFERGLAELERQRANVATDMRATLFDTVPELIAETVELLLAAGRDEDAYEVVERARARTLIEALGVPSDGRRAVGVGAIAASLPPDAAVIEYALLPNSVVAFCIRADGMTVVRLPVDRATLERRVDEFGSRIDRHDPITDVQQIAAALYDDLLRPLEMRLRGAEVLYIVPDRFLYAMPFSALFDARRMQYLIERHRVVISPSGAFLLRRATTPRATQPALIVSDPAARSGEWLPAARREASAIALLYPGSTLMRGAEATIGHFIDVARDSALIHYAGHAGVDDAAGGFLPLAPSAIDDGRLDATAISRLALTGTSLVILSACATMRGSAARVEGMPSISRAFLTAGAPAVLGMLWEIDDESAARLLLDFHERLARGGSPSAALRAAQCALLRSPSRSQRHPAAWAAAELLGVD
jgi:CHAT domain-containing protein/tetratricopeptide (TPR) repeat protein